MLRVIFTFILGLVALNSAAWNIQGHKLVAQIAFDHLTPKAKNMCQTYLSVRSKQSLNARFLSASIWADMLRLRNIHWYDSLHYTDIPFSPDNTALPSIDHSNAVWGINQAIQILSSKKTSKADKKTALSLLIHLVGDIHQPLHAATRVTQQLPKGDRGGNLFALGTNHVGNNLHQYWDKGAGYFTGSSKLPKIKAKANLLEKKWPCALMELPPNPQQWADAAHQLAIHQAYQINPQNIPSKKYQSNTINTVQKQVITAGCQLALILNHIAH